VETAFPKNDAEYFAHPYISNSDLKLINRSIKHYLWNKQHPEKTSAMIFGSAFHCYILEPEKFDERFVVNPFDSKRTNAYKDWALQVGDLDILTKDDMEKLKGMKEALLENPEVRALLNIDESFNFLGPHEVEKVHLFKFMGIGCKCKTDYESLQRDMIVDLKTCQDVSDSDEVVKIIIDYDYHQQSTFYQLGYSLDYKVEPPMFFFIFIEKEPPYGIRIKYCDKEFERIGLAQIKQGLSRWKYYLDNRESKSEYWGYTPNPSTALCPNWFRMKNTY
jgi:exodeoxyribonuclease VIII